MTENTDRARLLLSIRRQGVSQDRILKAFESIPRELFVPEAYRAYAYDDSALPIECGQTISQPSLIARMTAELEVGARMRVLEVGTGSGYQAAILAKLCRRVYTIERHRTLLRAAEQRFATLDLHNITTRLGDGGRGWPEQAPFPRIMLTAAAAKLPKPLLDQLEDGGIMVAPVGRIDDTQMLKKIIRRGDDFEDKDLVAVRFVPLIESER